MNGAQLHFLVNHLPIIVPAVGVLVLLSSLVTKSEENKKMGLWIILVGAICAAPAYFSGEPAEAVVKNYPGVSRLIINEHEEAAETAAIILGIGGFFAGVFLLGIKKRKKIPEAYFYMICGFISVALVFIAKAAHVGGEIRHEEIRSAVHQTLN